MPIMLTVHPLWLQSAREQGSSRYRHRKYRLVLHHQGILRLQEQTKGGHLGLMDDG